MMLVLNVPKTEKWNIPQPPHKESVEGEEYFFLDHAIRKLSYTHHFFFDNTQQAIVKREFEKYKAIWEHETMFSSSTTEMINHPAYLHIISLGEDVVPLLLRDMQQTSNYWFFALHKITNADPIPKEHEGIIQEMIKDWVQWAKGNNIHF